MSHRRGVVIFSLVGPFVLTWIACARNNSGSADAGIGSGSGGDAEFASGGAFRDASEGLIIGPVECPTTISGTVYDPANVNPIYNVTVYVPGIVRSASLPALPQGVTCNSCSDLYVDPQVATATDAIGHFSISDAPYGTSIPLVVQTGKWRMLYTIGSVTQCQDNPQPDHSLRLPRSHTEGDIPNIAISTGGADTLECLPFRLGVDPGEYVGGAGGQGRIHVFSSPGGATTSGGTSPDPSTTLWDKDTDINQFDVVLLSCEGTETMNMNQQVLLDYGNAGGRVFASHFQYAWFNMGPFSTMINPPLATWTPGAQPLGGISANIVAALPGGLAFPDGVAMNTWLGAVGALTGGELPIVNAFHNADVSATNTVSQSWISADWDSSAPGATQYFSFALPVGSPEGQCGHVVYSELHDSLGPDVGSEPDYLGAADGGIVPSGCSTHALTPQEKALEFMLFDLSSCSLPNTTVQQPPIIGSLPEGGSSGVGAATRDAPASE
ncbi:MAG: carboxypeptidase regulatory-like domain-containing protein [Polyangiaceae bacterium]